MPADPGLKPWAVLYSRFAAKSNGTLRDDYRSVKLLAVLGNIHFPGVVPLNDKEITDRQDQGGKPPNGGNLKTKGGRGAVSGG